MAVTRTADIANHIPKIWSSDLFAQAENLTFWHNMEGGPGSSMPIIRRDELNQDPNGGQGDTVKIDIVLALTGAGKTGDASTSLLEGNEEALKFRQTSVTVASLQHAVRWTWQTGLLITHDMRTTAKNQLAKWLASNLETNIFNEFTGAGSTTIPAGNIWAAGTATDRDEIEDTDTAGRLTLDTLTEAKAYAQTELKLEPIKMEDGNEYFALVAHPYTVMSLKRDDDKWAQAQREAQVRGDGNPLFTGSAGVWDGVIIYTSNRVPRAVNEHASPIQVSNNIFMGAQALSRAYAYYPDWTEEEFSYGQELGIATKTLVGQKLNVFDLSAAGDDSGNRAIGSMVLYASAVAPGQP